jgi:hypothetical protein
VRRASVSVQATRKQAELRISVENEPEHTSYTRNRLNCTPVKIEREHTSYKQNKLSKESERERGK